MTTFPGAEFIAGPGRLRNARVVCTWLDEARFVTATESDSGRFFEVVDARTGSRERAFDHELVAKRLSSLVGVSLAPDALPLERVAFGADGRSIRFRVHGGLYECSLAPDGMCRRLAPPDGVPSPDGRWVAVLRDHDLWLVSAERGVERRLTEGGSAEHAWAGSTGNSTAAVTRKLLGIPEAPQLRWSPDSARLLTHRIDERRVAELSLLQSVPGSNERPRMHRYRNAWYGEPKAMLTHHVIDVASGDRVCLDHEPIALPFVSMIEQRWAWWAEDSRSIFFVEPGPYQQSLSLRQADPTHGRVRTVLEERSDRFVELGEIGAQPNVVVTPDGDVVWLSRRDGYAHLYRFDLHSGLLKNRITDGPWMVREIITIDTAQRKVWFTASGREPGWHPVMRQLYCAGLDGCGLRLLTPADAEHEVEPATLAALDPSGLDRGAGGVGPGGSHFVYTRSRPDVLPRSFVADSGAGVVRQVAEGSVTGAQLSTEMTPEPFTALAADGTTQLHGTLYRPRGFDPRRRYALVDAIYPGPQSRRVGATFERSVFDIHGALAMAQRGLVVFTVDGRGTPDRSQAFLDHSYGRLSDAGSLEDHLAVIRQLCERHAFLDAARVGVYGFSGGGYAAARAILLHPEVYRAAVAGCGNHQQHRYIAVWGETYDGPHPAVVPDNTILAERLQGALLLIHGELDDNVHPLHTMALADALIRADKDFDMLMVPGAGHAFGHALAYVFRRTGDFLVRHLGGPQ